MNKTEDSKIFTTLDGSPSVEILSMDETYHSRHGALTESKHVFIQAGLEFVARTKNEITILEVGLGTALNAALTLNYACVSSVKVNYIGLEPFPISQTDILEIQKKWRDYTHINSIQQLILNAPWEEEVLSNERMMFMKMTNRIQEIVLKENCFDLVYYDAFAPRVQSEMWTVDIFQKLFRSMKTEGVFVTYCAKGQVRRDLQSVGFVVERLPGPPNKREMLRAVKPMI